MIVISGFMDINPNDVEAARAATIAMMTESEKEDGCIRYRFYQDVEHPHLFHVYEEWESEEALAAHAASDHMAEWRAKIGALKTENVLG